PYSASKAAADMLARSYFVTYGLPVIITRSSNNFGPYQYPEKVIPLFITNLIRKKRVPLYGDGLNVRDWLYVRDNCAAIDLVLRKGRVGQVYNIGGDCEMTNRRLTSTILRKMGRGKEYIKYVRDRLGHDRRYSLDCEKIKALGWRPEYSFGRALDLTIRWYRDNQIWWERLIRGA
ncbi:MAG: dTDP-glucose 4,6-dehydratase, partial [Candidatus Omnitrophota bacterium]